MIRRLRTVRKTILDRFPQSSLEPLSPPQLATVMKRFPDLPDHLKKFFKEIG